ncbi:MAG: hypothetical protein KDA21_04600 [Phycisphaerales bacterium]|nr:hypothetical protein [Phycisphaerales bacterium]
MNRIHQRNPRAVSATMTTNVEMNIMIRKLAWAAALLLTLAAAVTTSRADVPPLPDTPAPIVRLVEARPFRLEQNFIHQWRTETPQYNAGWLLVLEVDPALVFPRQTEEPVLYVGDQTAQRLNTGAESGYIVAVVPVEDMTTWNLAEQMIWFGTPAFPEQVDARHIAREKTLAENAGIRPVGDDEVAAARTRAGTATLRRPTLHQVMPEAGRLVEHYAPEDRSLADQLQGRATQAPPTRDGGPS